MKANVTLKTKKRFLIPGAITALALIAAPVFMDNVIQDLDGVISTAYASGSDSKGKQTKSSQSGGNRGGNASGVTGGSSSSATSSSGHTSADTTTGDSSSGGSSSGGSSTGSGGGSASGGKGNRGGSAAPRGRRTLTDVLSADAEDDDGDDSDRPDWAGSPGRDGKPGGGNFGGSTKKGGDYGDLWVILRDDNGIPILNDGGFVQPLDVEGNLIPLDEEGHPLDESLTQEVEFGRLNIARSPSKVLDHALSEALSKLDGLIITPANVDDYTDPAGRLVDADGNTIDSPLESLALYQALIDGMVNDEGNIVIRDGDLTLTVNSTIAMDLAASAFAAGSDKTGELNVDEVAYISGFLDVDISAALTDAGNYTYDREDTYGDVKVWVLIETAPDVFTPQLVNIMDVVTFNDIPAIVDDGNGIDTFTQAADDALQVLEYVHDNALEQ